jgi:hypothetical protein
LATTTTLAWQGASPATSTATAPILTLHDAWRSLWFTSKHHGAAPEQLKMGHDECPNFNLRYHQLRLVGAGLASSRIDAIWVVFHLAIHPLPERQWRQLSLCFRR